MADVMIAVMPFHRPTEVVEHTMRLPATRRGRAAATAD
jgi:hypothetical protein